MDKNPARFEHGANVLLCHDAFAKQWAAARIAEGAGAAAHYLDLDMLYSGYLGAGMAPESGARVVMPGPGELVSALRGAVGAAGRGMTVILDSLNGMHAQAGPGMAADSYVMLLAAAARSSGSRAFVLAVARESGGGWVTRPGGARVPEAGPAFFVDAGRRVGRLGEGRAARI